MSTSVLALAATGYIGGSVLAQIIKAHPDFTYTALIRNPKDKEAVEKIGATVVIGSNDDYALVEKLSSEHDVVINSADADGLPLTKAVIAGLEKRAGSKSGSRPILLHTSGTGVVADAATGEFNPGTSEKIYNDNSVEDIKSIDKDQPHRNVDLEIFAASERGEIDAYIIAPSTIYGKGIGPVRNLTQQMPNLVRAAVQRKQAIHVGKGTNLWNNVHIEDLADLYSLVLDFGLSGKNTNKSYANFFWGSVGEHQWGDIAARIAPILYEKGLVESPTPQSISPSELPFPDLSATATNSRTLADRGFNLGWKPSRPSFIDSIPSEVELTLSQI